MVMGTKTYNAQQWLDMVWAKGYEVGWQMGPGEDDQLIISKPLATEGLRWILLDWDPDEFAIVQTLIAMVPVTEVKLEKTDNFEQKFFVLHCVQEAFFEEVTNLIDSETMEGHKREELHQRFSLKIAEEVQQDPDVVAIDQELVTLASKVHEIEARRERIISDKTAELESNRERFLFVADSGQFIPREL